MILRILSLGVFLMLFLRPGLAAEPFVRVELMTKGRIVAGQQVEIAVSVYAPHFFKDAPDFPVFKMDGAIVTLPQQRAENLNETVDDVDYSGIRKSYMVMPEQAGSFSVPAISIDVAYAGDGTETLKGQARSSALTFAADAVPGDWGGQIPLVAGDLKIVQTLDRDPASLKTGDALVRTIRISADDTQPMMIPVPDLTAPDGVKLYRADPTLTAAGSDHNDPAAVSRSEAVTYVVEKSGSVIVPAIDIKWFDPQKGTIETAEAPAVELDVKDNPAGQAIGAGGPQTSFDQEASRRGAYHYLMRAALFGVSALALFSIVYVLGIRMKTWLDEARARWAVSEPAVYRRALMALAGSDPLLALKALDIWTRQSGFRSSAECARSMGSDEFRRAFDRFQKALFGGGTHEEARAAMKELERHLPGARHRMVDRERRKSTEAVLQQLNP